MKKSPNFGIGRRGYKPEAIVIHITQGEYGGALSWLTNPKSQVSAHFLTNKFGGYEQLVKCQDTAWHAGIVTRPTWGKIKKGVNPNLYTIGIENAGWVNIPPTEMQLKTLAMIVKSLCLRFAIPMTTDYVIPHHAIRADKSCPGPYFDCTKIVAMARLPETKNFDII